MGEDSYEEKSFERYSSDSRVFKVSRVLILKRFLINENASKDFYGEKIPMKSFERYSSASRAFKVSRGQNSCERYDTVRVTSKALVWRKES